MIKYNNKFISFRNACITGNRQSLMEEANIIEIKIKISYRV